MRKLRMKCVCSNRLFHNTILFLYRWVPSVKRTNSFTIGLFIITGKHVSGYKYVYTKISINTKKKNRDETLEK